MGDKGLGHRLPPLGVETLFGRQVIGARMDVEHIAVAPMLVHTAPRVLPVVIDLATQHVAPNAPDVFVFIGLAQVLVTQHDVVGAGALSGAKLISNANIIPATVTAKFHFDLGSGVKPYLGAGPSYFMIFGEDPDSTAQALGATRVDLSSEFGFALQGGVDVPLNDGGLGLSIDAKRYFMNTTARFFAGNTLALSTKHELDPWVVSAGISYRF